MYRSAANGQPNAIVVARLQALTPTPVPLPVVLIDVPALMGMTQPQVAVLYGEPFTNSPISGVNSESMPHGGVERAYTRQWGVVAVGYEDGRAVRIALTFDSGRPELPRSWQDAMSVINLPRDQRPDHAASTLQRYTNLDGRTVQLMGNTRAEVGTILVWRYRGS
jgi:hypothetical protein